MFRTIKYLFYLAVLSSVGLVGYTFFGDIDPPVTQVRQQVTLDDL